MTPQEEQELRDRIKASLEITPSERRDESIRSWAGQISVPIWGMPPEVSNALVQSAVSAGLTGGVLAAKPEADIASVIQRSIDETTRTLTGRLRQGESSLSEGVDVIEALRVMRKESEDASIKLAVANDDTRRFLQSRMSSEGTT